VPGTLGVLPLMDFFHAGASWRALRDGVGGVEQLGSGGASGRLVGKAVSVVDTMMLAVLEALPLATHHTLAMGRLQTRDPMYGRSTSLVHVEMVTLAAYVFGAEPPGRAGVAPPQDGRELFQERRAELIKSCFALCQSLGPGDESIVMRLVDGILLPHLCSPDALARSLTSPEIFHLGGTDALGAATAIRDYYLHWLKRLLSSEGEGVIPLSTATWTYNQAAILTMARPLKSSYLPLPRDFLLLPLSIALKAVTQDADTHLAIPEFRRASGMALSLVHILLSDCSAQLQLLLLGRAGAIGGTDATATEAIFCRVGSVFLLGSDVYLDESVAPALACAVRAISPPLWLDSGGSAHVRRAGLDLSKRSVKDLEAGKLFTSLASQLTQDSFGDTSLSHMLVTVFHPRLPAHWRTEVWEVVAPYYLNLLRCVPEGLPGGLSSFVWPPEQDLAMLHNYRIALQSGHMTAHDNPFLFHLAVHHLSRYIFNSPPHCNASKSSPSQGASGAHGAGKSGLGEGPKQLLRSLIRESTPTLYLSICSYISPPDSSLEQGGADCQQLVSLMRGERTLDVRLPGSKDAQVAEDLAARWDSIVAVCAKDEDTLKKARHDGGVLAQEAFLFLQRDRVC